MTVTSSRSLVSSSEAVLSALWAASDASVLSEASLEAVEDAPEQPAREPAARQAAVNSAATDFFFIISPPKKYNYLADSRMIAGIVQKPKF